MQSIRLCDESINDFREAPKSLWLNREKCNRFWDVVLVFPNGSKLLCSQRDLSFMSRYFKTMFESNFIESQSRQVLILDVQCCVMECMVAFYYMYEVSHETYDWWCLFKFADLWLDSSGHDMQYC